MLVNGEIHCGPSPSGEILARGPQAFSGYLDPRQMGATFHEGWLRSGDLGRIGEDGEVYVTGRAKDMIIRGGHNIDPADIEDVALRFPGVGLAAAVGRPDSYAGETPVLFVSPSPGASIDRAALADYVQAGVAEPPARPRSIVVVDEMPTTLVGKIFKPRLREIAAEDAARELSERRVARRRLRGRRFAQRARTDAAGESACRSCRGCAGRARQAAGRLRDRFRVRLTS